MLFLGSAAALVLGAGLLLAETLGRAGRAVVPAAAWRREGPLGRWGLGFLFGSAALGPAYLGLALAGLFTPPLLAALLLLAAAAGSLRRGRRGPLLPPALRALGGLGPVRGATAAVVAGLAVAPVLAPEFELDAVVYHLGVAGQWLLARRALLQHVPFTFHFPLPVEMLFALPLGFGDTRGARVLVALHAAAAAAWFTGRRLARRDPDGALAGLLAALGGTYLSWLLSVAKSDVAASAFAVTGAMLALEGGTGAGFLLLGAAAAAKVVYGPALLPLGLLLAARAPRRAGAMLAAGALPLVPWIVKSFLATGTPLYPFTAGLWPSYDWDARNATTLHTYAIESWDPATLTPAGVPGAWLAAMRTGFLPALVALPWLAWNGGTRGAALAVVAGQLAVLASGHLARFMIPGSWLLAWLTGPEVARLPARARAVLLVVLAAAGAGRLAREPLLRRSLELAWMGPAAARAEGFTTYGEAGAALAAGGIRRVVTVGEWKTWGLPARILYDGAQAETPLVWRLARESATPARLRTRFRELGTSALLYNYVSTEWIMKRNAGFAWNDRMVRVYAGFCRAALERTWASGRCDFVNGGYVLYRVLPRDRTPPAAAAYHLPGAASLMAPAMAARRAERLAESAAALEALVRKFPDAWFLRAEWGYGLAALRQWPRVYTLLGPLVREGTPDAVALPTYGLAAMETGRLDEAEAVLLRCWDVYTTQREELRINIAGIHMERAAREAAGHRAAATLAELDAAARWLEPVPDRADLKERRASRLNWIAAARATVIRRGGAR